MERDLRLGHIVVAERDCVLVAPAERKVGAILEAPAGIVVAGAVTFACSQYALANLQNTKDEKRDVATRDTLHGAMLMSLELPQGFRDEEIRKLGVTTTKQSPVIKISERINASPVQVRLQGSCAGCAFATMTLQVGVEKTLKKYFPHMERVENLQ